MSTTAEFRRALDGVDAESTVTTPATFETDLQAAVEPPAVGAPLPFDDVSLTGTDVTLDPTTREITGAKTGVTGSRLGIAALGTVAVRSRAAGDELVSLYPERHVVVIRERDIRSDLASAFERVSDVVGERDSLVLATGPSATGDMGELVQGVHGPSAVHVLLVRANE